MACLRDELEKHEDYFSDVAFNILSAYKVTSVFYGNFKLVINK